MEKNNAQEEIIHPKHGSIIDYMEFYKSQPFKDWQKDVEKDIQKKCHFFTDKNEIEKIINQG